jgi:hypothetical protein
MRSSPIRVSTIATAAAFAALVAGAGCASILNIEDRSLEWCLEPQNAHAFCEDFDHQNPTADWSFAPSPPSGTSRTFVPSDYDPPNALAMDTLVEALPTGESSFSGLQQAFTSQVFNQVVVGVDVRIVSAAFMADSVDPNLVTGAGFLLLSDVVTQSAMGASECIGLALAPAGAGQVGIDVILVPDSSDCLTVGNLMTDAGPQSTDDDGGAAGGAVAGLPWPLANVFLDQWFRLTLTITRKTDGSGTIDFRVPSGSSMAPPPIPAGSLNEGYPSLAIGTDVTGPSGNIEVQFDNVTVDFLAAN